MASVDGLKRKFKEWKPFVQSAFVVYVRPQPSPIAEPDLSYEVINIRTPDHPILPKICTSKHQLKVARKALAEGRWNIIVALDDGVPIGRIWQTVGTEKALFSGIPRMRLADDEFFMFDLFVEREYRKSGVAFTMADYFFTTEHDPATTKMKCGYGFVAYENVPSIMWHHSVNFFITQTVNYLSIGPFIKWKIPFSDMPRFGPWSRKGRHTDKSREPFGPRLLP